MYYRLEDIDATELGTRIMVDVVYKDSSTHETSLGFYVTLMVVMHLQRRSPDGCIWIQPRGYDQYGRTLVRVYLDANSNLDANSELISEGWAHASVSYSKTNEYIELMHEKESVAKKSRKGIWGIVSSAYKSPMEYKKSSESTSLPKHLFGEYMNTHYLLMKKMQGGGMIKNVRVREQGVKRKINDME